MPHEKQRRAAAFLADAELFHGAPDDDVAAVYDRAADRYDRFRKLWLRLAGAGADEAMLADLRAALRPGAKVLDAGCGTGVLARRVRELEPDVELTLVDLSAAMLARASDVPGEHVRGSVLELPFADGTFEVVVSAWVIETVPDPMRAVSEYLRVLNPHGHVLYTFCSFPHGWFSRAGSAWLRNAVRRGFAGSSSAARARHGTTATARICSGSATASRPRWRSRSAAPLERPCCRAPFSCTDSSAALCASCNP